MKNTFNEIHFDIRLGDCLDVLKDLKENSVDSIVCDPPYGLSFMGKKWDYDVPSQEIWEECLRVLKPGGHLLAFAGSRTYHRMAVRIEDAGFEIRDQIMWIYGSGFPKSHNIAKAVDEKLGNQRKIISIVESGAGPLKRGHVNKGGGGGLSIGTERSPKYQITKGNSEWEGWGTALKPAHEPIVMARKPFKGNVAQNVLDWGTGGINIDDSRIEIHPKDHIMKYPNYSNGEYKSKYENGSSYTHGTQVQINPEGRFPANVILDKEAGKLLDNQSGTRKGFSGGGGPTRFGGASGGEKLETYNYHNDNGGASRFFYCPKASKKDRNEGLEDFEDKQRVNYGGFHSEEGLIANNRNPDKRLPTKNNHPTIKPTDLMRYLIRMVTPSGGITLDPFMGSGSTGKAALKAGFSFIGIEREKEYFEIAKARLEHQQKKNKGKQINLFE